VILTSSCALSNPPEAFRADGQVGGGERVGAAAARDCASQLQGLAQEILRQGLQHRHHSRRQRRLRPDCTLMPLNMLCVSGLPEFIRAPGSRLGNPAPATPAPPQRPAPSVACSLIELKVRGFPL